MNIDDATAVPRTEPSACCICGPEAGKGPEIWAAACRDRLHGVPGDYSYARCGNCGTLFQQPRVITVDLAMLYPTSYSPWTVGAGRVTCPPRWKRRLRDALTITGLSTRVQARLNSGGRLLDVGCGNGRFLARILSEHPAASVEGVDFSPEACAATSGALGVPVHCGTLTGLMEKNLLHPGSFDVITFWWVLEHDPDPRGTLAAVHQLLAPGGFLLLGVPSAASLTGRLFRSRWFHLDPPRHLWIFHPRSIKRWIQDAGFHSVRVRQDISPWGILGSLQYLVQGRIHAVEDSWVSSRLLQALFRPASLIMGLCGCGDTVALEAVRSDAAAAK